MLFRPPELSSADRAVLDLIEGQRVRLKTFTENSPSRWLGSLRRSTFARAIQGSNSIEGYRASVDDALAVVAAEPLSADLGAETQAALQGYRTAMTYVMQAAKDPYFEYSAQFLKGLQFMMVGFDLRKTPGQWRPGGIFVVDQASGQVVYEGPDAALVNDLVGELVAALRARTDRPVLVDAAMAHLNLTMIHPFRDGNGRMARAVQTLVLAREGLLYPVFCSIEEWLGRHTPDYYAVLAQVGGGRWSPQRSAAPWLRFCLRAHYQQAATLIRRNEEYAALFTRIEAAMAAQRLPERVAVSLFDAALGWQITNTRYRTDADVGDFQASRDLRRLCEAGLLMPIGEKRARVYRAAEPLRQLRAATRLRRPVEDPYDIAGGDPS